MADSRRKIIYYIMYNIFNKILTFRLKHLPELLSNLIFNFSYII